MGKLPHVLVVPLPAQGHVMPLMKFSYQLVDHGVKVTFINTESVHKKVVSTLLDVEVVKPDNKISLVAIPDKVIIVEGEEKSIEFISETMAAHLENVINKINASDNEKIDYVVADACLGGILEVAEKFGIEGAAFWPASLGFLACMLHFPKLVEAGELDDNGNPMKEEDIILPPGMPAMSTIDYLWGLSDDPYMRKVMLAFIFNVNKATKVAKWMLCNSFCELEPASHEIIPKILTVGPLLASEKLGRPKGQLLPEDSTCLTWLDRQPAQSVIYAAFGSTTIFNQSQFNELVNALELINKPFLWVVRPGLTDELNTSILDGFKDRIGPLGKIIDWAPQQKVLAHPCIACFITHCGWNSIMEGVSMGVPLLCWPYIVDQFHNENYICNILKVGLRFKKDENRIITRSEIQTKVQEVLRDEGIRSRAIKLKELAWRSISEGGSSSKNYEVFINSIKSAGMNIPHES